ncbi:MAG: DMT family transporter [Actinomycetota bacterium]|nr:DMT family transporter [Actinomycetota bacterium]
MTPRRTGLLLALATATISGFAVFLNSYGVRAVGNATTYTTLKNSVALLVLLGVVGALTAARPRRRPLVSRPTRPVQWAGLAVVGLVGGAVAFVLFFEGLARASSTNAAFLHKTLLIWVALLAVPLLGERLGVWHVLAIGLLVVGQVGLAGGGSSLIGAGEAMVLAATVLWAGEVVLAKWLLAGLTSWTLALARMGVGSAVLVAWTAARGGFGVVASLTAAQWGWVLLTGLLLAGYVGTWYGALAHAPAVDVTAVLVVGSVITTVLATAVNGAPLAPQLGWVLVILAGGALVAVPLWRAPQVAPA